MEQKFEIKYMFSKDMIDSIKKVKTISKFNSDTNQEGWILLKIGSSEYGWLPLQEYSDGFELLYVWFKYLKDVYQKLQDTSKVFLEYWENPFDFFIFTRACGEITIQYYNRVLPVENGSYQKSCVHEIKLLAETVVPENDFFNTVKNAVNNFWNEINKLNPIVSTVTEKYFIR